MIKKFIKQEQRNLDLQWDFIRSFIEIRKNDNLSQQEIANKMGTLRETIAKIENGINSPQVKTMIDLLEPIGLTLKIVPIGGAQKYE